jgi:hypothetical protein
MTTYRVGGGGETATRVQVLFIPAAVHGAGRRGDKGAYVGDGGAADVLWRG